MADVATFVYVYADSRHDQPIAVVFPKKEKIAEWESRGITDIQHSDVVKKEILESLAKIHKVYEMRGFERISDVVIETEEPTNENGLMTPSMKPQYASFKRRFGEELEACYRRIEEKNKKEKEEQQQQQQPNNQ